jgi:hypothetical protein
MNAKGAQHDPDVTALQTLNDAYMRSIEFSDVRWFDAHLSPDFMNSGFDGSLLDRQGFLEYVAKPAMISELRACDVRIRILGEVAIIHGRTTYAKADGKPGAGRYTDVWARRSGEWLCVAAHVTRGVRASDEDSSERPSA